MKIPLLLLLITSLFASAQEKAAEGEKQPPAPPAHQVFERRYEVFENDSGGIVAAEMVQQTIHHNIPGRSSRVGGGGGGLSLESKEWRETGVTVFIPHTKGTANITGGEKFTARVWIDGSTRRTEYDELYRVHRILEIIPVPAKKQP